MKKFISLIMAAFMLCLLSAAVFSAQPEITRHETLTTTNDPSRYAVFTADGDIITASGFFRDDVVLRWSMPEIPRGERGHDIIYVELQSGQNLAYRVDYEKGYGWYFAEHTGLSGRNSARLEQYEVTPPSITAQYLTGTDSCRDNAASVLEEIRTITAQVTEGLNSGYDKARAISGWVADNIYYDMIAFNEGISVDSVALSTVLAGRKATCSGFANLTAAMLEAAGLKSATVIGNALSHGDFHELPTKTRRHEWTAFWYEEQSRWVMLDSGWDTWSRYDENGYNRRTDSPRKFFDITELALAQTHRAVKVESRSYFAVLDYFDGVTDTVAGNVVEDPEDPDATDNVTVGNTETTPETTITEEQPQETERSTVFPYLIPILIVVVGILIFGIIHESLY
jgi:transglutaminase-like putative cysteine protease